MTQHQFNRHGRGATDWPAPAFPRPDGCFTGHSQRLGKLSLIHAKGEAGCLDLKRTHLFAIFPQSIQNQPGTRMKMK